MAPMLAAASMAAMVSGILGMKPATRSPATTPMAFIASANRATRLYSWPWLSRRLTLSSPQNTMASSWSRRRSRFSAKLRRASGNHRAPGMRPGSSTTIVPLSVPITPQKSQTSRQNPRGSSIDHCQSGAIPSRRRSWRRLTRSMKAVTRAWSTRRAEGCQSRSDMGALLHIPRICSQSWARRLACCCWAEGRLRPSSSRSKLAVWSPIRAARSKYI